MRVTNMRANRPICHIQEIRKGHHSLNDSVDAPEIGGEDWERGQCRFNVGIVWGQSEKGL